MSAPLNDAEDGSSTMPLSTSSERPRVLLVSPYSIHPMIHGGAVRMGALLRRISATCDVDVFIFLGGSDDPAQRAALAPFCSRVFFQQLPESPSADPRLPPDVASFTDRRIAERLRALVLAYDYDFVQLEYAELGAYADPSFTGVDLGVPVILTEHDLSFRAQERRQAAGIEARYRPQEAQDAAMNLRRDFELQVCRRAARIHLMSESDRDLLRELLPEAAGRMRVIPNGVDPQHYTPPDVPAPRERLLFVGSFPHLPNLDAAQYFLEEIWLQLKGQIPSLRLTLAGARPPDEILALDGEHDVEVAGEVESLLPLYRGHRMLVVPLRAGSGTRLKILEAMACGLPVVSTTIGAEGLGARAEEHLLIADEPASLMEACLRVVTDDNLAARLAAGGRLLVERRFSWNAIAERLVDDYFELQAETPRRISRPPSISSRNVDAPEADPVDVSVLVFGPMSDACRRMLDAQEIDGTWEIVPVETSLNHAAAGARGRILATLAGDAESDDPRWLAKLIAPFAHEAPPAAVAGKVHELYSGSARRHLTTSTSLHRALREQLGGFDFSFANAAFRRDVWEAFPFGESPREEWAWLRRARANGLLVQPILAAWILRHRAADVASLRREARAEGAALRAFGLRPERGGQGRSAPWRAVDGESPRDLLALILRGGSLAARLHPWLWPREVMRGARGDDEKDG